MKSKQVTKNLPICNSNNKNNHNYQCLLLGINNVQVHYKNKDDLSAKKIIRETQLYHKKLSKIFKVKVDLIRIILIYSRKEMNSYWGSKTPNWLIGFEKKGILHIFSPAIFKKNKKRKAEIKKLLIHELAHLFVGEINNKPLVWINEGVALFLANQKKNTALKKDHLDFLTKKNVLFENIKMNEFSEKSGYIFSYKMINKIYSQYGMKKLLDLIKIKAGRKSKDRVLNLLKLNNSNWKDYFYRLEK